MSDHNLKDQVESFQLALHITTFHIITLSNLLQGALVVLVVLAGLVVLAVPVDLVDPASHPMATNPLA